VAAQLRRLESQLEQSAPDARPLVEEALEELQRAIAELGEIARGIHPAQLAECGLVVAVEALVRQMPVPVTLRQSLAERLPESIEAAFYHVIAESFTNACKHADATAISVDIVRADCRAWVEITDDGVGGAAAREGSGLGGLADRLAALEGTLVVVSPAGGGTSVRAEVPCA
jgi:signal transduction histidine kinase